MAGKPAHKADGATMRDVRALLARGWTRDRIARELGMSRTTLWRLERQGGKR